MKIKVFAAAMSLVAVTGYGFAQSVINLSDMRTFEVNHFQGAMQQAENQAFQYELNMHLRRELENSNVLQFRSPADATIHLECAGFQCRQVNVTVTHGSDGPVIWQEKVDNYRGGIPYWALEDPKAAAERITERLEAVYQAEIKSQHHNVSHTERIEPTETPAANPTNSGLQ